MKFEKYVPGVSKMEDSDESEVIHIFEVMSKHNVLCSLELKLDANLDPFTGFVDQPVYLVEYLERPGGPDSILMEFGDGENRTDFNFQLNLHCYKSISDSQICICIATEQYSAFFNSGHVLPEAIAEARDYTVHDEFADVEYELNVTDGEFEDSIGWITDRLNQGQVIKKSAVVGDGKQVLTVGFYRSEDVEHSSALNVTQQESELIQFIRSLAFDDLLDAEGGIQIKEEDARVSVLRNRNKGDQYNANAFQERADALKKLAELLGEANQDYRNHILV